MSAATILQKGGELFYKYREMKYRLKTEKLEAKFLINIEMDMELRSDRDYMLAYDCRNGLTPPMYGIPVEIDNLVKDLELWVQVK